jgi:hypothetical protein
MTSIDPPPTTFENPFHVVMHFHTTYDQFAKNGVFSDTTPDGVAGIGVGVSFRRCTQQTGVREGSGCTHCNVWLPAACGDGQVMWVVGGPE